jgi:hypothetical protein
MTQASTLTSPAHSADAGDEQSPVSTSDREPSIFLISLHILMWTTLGCGLIMVLVVVMLNA